MNDRPPSAIDVFRCSDGSTSVLSSCTYLCAKFVHLSMDFIKCVGSGEFCSTDHFYSPEDLNSPFNETFNRGLELSVTMRLHFRPATLLAFFFLDTRFVCLALYVLAAYDRRLCIAPEEKLD